MKRTPREILNKEKAIFILFALIFSAGIYRFAATQPVTLEPGKPFVAKDGPVALEVSSADQVFAERDYFRGQRNPLRKPNAPPHPPLPKIVEKQEPSRPIGPPPREMKKPGGGESFFANNRPFDPKSLGLEYMGIVMAGGKTCALLRTSNSATPHRVVSSEKVAGTGVSVAKIEPWAVWLSDGQGVGVLKNKRFAEPQAKDSSRAP